MVSSSRDNSHGISIGTLAAAALLAMPLTMAVPALAQGQTRAANAAGPAATSAPAKPSVEGYLCTFAGKCGEQTDQVIERDAPNTRGFRLARPGAERASGPAVDVTGAAAYPGKRTVTRNYGTQTRPAATPGRLRSSLRPQPAYNNTGRASYPARTMTATGLTTGSATAQMGAPAGARRADLMIGFDLNSAQLSAAGRESARIFAQSLLLPALATKRFTVEGHTDLRGGRALNLALSQRRAQAVVDYLAAQGVDRMRLTARGLGPDAPLAGRTAADPANRRVEAELLP